jgi:hypothetical protein
MATPFQLLNAFGLFQVNVQSRHRHRHDAVYGVPVTGGFEIAVY